MSSASEMPTREGVFGKGPVILTHEFLCSFDWSIISPSTSEEIVDYSNRFRVLKEQSSQSDLLLCRLLDFFDRTAHFGGDNDLHTHAFGAGSRQLESIRRMYVEYSINELNLISEYVDRIPWLDLKALVCDILRILTSNYKMLQAATHLYLESAKAIELRNGSDNWVHLVQRLRRGMSLSRFLGRDERSILYEYIRFINDVIIHGKDIFTGFKIAKLMQLLIDFRAGNPEEMALIAMQVAKRVQIENNPRISIDYYYIASTLFQKAKNTTAEKEAKKLAAEMYVEEASLYADPGNKAALISQAIEAFRQTGGCKERIKQLTVMLDGYERLIPDTLQRFKYEIPAKLQKGIEEDTINAENAVRDCDFGQAIFNLALITDPPSVAELQKELEREGDAYIFRALCATKKIDKYGRTKAVIGTYTRNNDDKSLNTTGHLVENALWHYSYGGAVRIWPATNVIMSRFSFDWYTLAAFLWHSPFVPEDRITTYARGIFEGFRGEFHAALHFLIPQLENSIRYVYEKHGIPTFAIEKNGIRKGMGLGVLLCSEQAAQIFGEDTIFNLKALFTEDAGMNLRHLFAHGLLDDEALDSPLAVYAWWVILRLCFVPMIIKYQHARNAEAEE